MPDHAHALLAVAPDKSLQATLAGWKSWNTKLAGIKWQSGFFDHRLRSDESFEEKAHYIRQNPVRAGLVPRAEDWPHVWMPAEH
jgi:REP element-mobilizing transposase RayT